MSTNVAKTPLSITRPDLLLSAEAFVFLVANLLLYERLFPGGWGFFALLFLAPDISIIPFASKAKAAATVFYNLCHNYVLPLTLTLMSWKYGWLHAEQFSLIWLAHISLDRLIGFGLKYPESFKFTHMQRSAAIGDLEM